MNIFQRRHYKKIVQAIQKIPTEKRTEINDFLIPIFKEDNPKFKLEKYLKESYKQETKEPEKNTEK